jgi:hypothetical protein
MYGVAVPLLSMYEHNKDEVDLNTVAVGGWSFY